MVFLGDICLKFDVERNKVSLCEEEHETESTATPGEWASMIDMDDSGAADYYDT